MKQVQDSPHWISGGSHWQEGVTVTLQACSAAGSPQSSLLSPLTGVLGQLLPFKCALTPKPPIPSIPVLLIDLHTKHRLLVFVGSGAKCPQGSAQGCSCGWTMWFLTCGHLLQCPNFHCVKSKSPISSSLWPSESSSTQPPSSFRW